MALGDRRRRGVTKKEGAEPPRAAPKAPLVEKPAATPKEPARPPTRERSAPREKPAETAPASSGDDLMDLGTSSRSASDAITVPKASAPVARPRTSDAELTRAASPTSLKGSEAPASADPTRELSESDLEPFTAPEAPVVSDTPVATTEATRPTSSLTTVEFTARFNAPGGVYNIRAAGLKLQLAEFMGANDVKVVLSGGRNELSVDLIKDTPFYPTYELSDGTSVNVALKYTGKNISGTAFEVAGAIEGPATKLAMTVGRAADAAKSVLSAAPSKWRYYLSHIPGAAIMALGATTAVCSFAVPGLKSLGTMGQYGLALGGIAAVFIGGWSAIERIRFNQRIR